MEERIQNNSLKCYNCGKIFITNQAIIRHKNRKTPCLIREVTQDQINSPNRCIFCNKIFKHNFHLTRHLKTCKIKNGGMDILDDKIRYEQKFQILEKQHEIDHEKIQELIEEIELIKKQLTDQPKQAIGVQNNAINQIINQTNNIIINFYNYNKPKLDALKLTQDDLLGDVNRMLIEKIYFNKTIPENHVLYRPNLKELRLLVYKDGNWKNIVGDNLAPVFRDIKDVVYLTGFDKINSGDLYKTDDEFTQLYPVVQNSIQQFNKGIPIANETLMEIITECREIARGTIDSQIINQKNTN